jgi:hypothetical protein
MHYYTQYIACDDMNFRRIISIIVILVMISSGITSIPGKPNPSRKEQNQFCYGFVINVTENQSPGTQTNITRVINKLLSLNTSIFWITSDLHILTQGLENNSTLCERFFNRGSILISIGDNSLTTSTILSIIYMGWLAEKLDVYFLMQPVSNITAYRLLIPRIAYYNGTSVDHYFYPNLLAFAGFQHLTPLGSEEVVSELSLDTYNVFLWGGQRGSTIDVLSDILSPLGLQVRDAIQTFVENGGGYIGSCYGGWRAASGYRRPQHVPLDLGYNQLLNFLPLQLHFLSCPVYRALPGGGPVTLRLINHEHPITFGLPDNLTHLLYFAGPMFLTPTSKQSTLESIAVLSAVEHDWWWNDYKMELVPFWNSKILSNKTKYLIEYKWMNTSIGATMWVTQTFGKGRVIAFGTHPEYTHGYDSVQGIFSPPRIVYNSIWYTTASDPLSITLDENTSYSYLTVHAGGPYHGLVNHHIQFYGAIENGVPPYHWNWEFELPRDDYFFYPLNNTRQEQNPWFSYSEPGIYQVSLVVTDSNGNIGYDVTSVNVG